MESLPALLTRYAGKKTHDELLGTKEDRFLAPLTQEEKDHLHCALVSLHRKRIAQLIAQKCLKHQGQRILECMKDAGRNLNLTGQHCWLWRLDNLRTLHRKLSKEARIADHEEAVESDRARRMLQLSIRCRQLNTTQANAQSVAHVASYFQAQDTTTLGAAHVFEQVVRPWCSSVIASPGDKNLGFVLDRRICADCARRVVCGMSCYICGSLHHPGCECLCPALLHVRR